MKKFPHILILYTGGTFGMDLHQDPSHHSMNLAIPRLSPKSLKNRLNQEIPELQKLAQCEVDILLNRDSAHMGPEEWLLIAQRIKTLWKNYDGIVLLHGTDTLAYTACALSFLLRPCLKPIVITGAQRPLSALRTDARTNLISAVEIAAEGPREQVRRVTVFFQDQLFLGTRVRKKSALDFAAFESPHFPPIAIVGTTIRYDAHSTKNSSQKPLLQPQLSEKILMLHLTPGFPAESLNKEFLSKLDGIVLIVFHSWTAPTHRPEFLEFLKIARRQNIPIVVTTESSTQPPGLASQSIHYDAGSELFKNGCLSAGLMTPECTYVKMAYLLGQPQGKKRFRQLWKSKLANEE